jgi:hypothetical protein
MDQLVFNQATTMADLNCGNDAGTCVGLGGDVASSAAVRLAAGAFPD